jgi:hypothetical protein
VPGPSFARGPAVAKKVIIAIAMAGVVLWLVLLLRLLVGMLIAG